MQGTRIEGHKLVFFEVVDMGSVKLSAMGNQISVEVAPDGYLLSLDEAEEMAEKTLTAVAAVRKAQKH